MADLTYLNHPPLLSSSRNFFTRLFNFSFFFCVSITHKISRHRVHFTLIYYCYHCHSKCVTAFFKHLHEHTKYHQTMGKMVCLCVRVFGCCIYIIHHHSRRAATAISFLFSFSLYSLCTFNLLLYCYHEYIVVKLTFSHCTAGVH